MAITGLRKAQPVASPVDCWVGPGLTLKGEKMDEPTRNAYCDYATQYYDEALWYDLTLIDAEIAKRKLSNPFEPYVAWAMMARLEAMARFEARTTVRA